MSRSLTQLSVIGLSHVCLSSVTPLSLPLLRDAYSVHAMKLDDSGDARLLQEHIGHAKYRKIAGEEHREWYDRLCEGTGARG